MLIWLTNDSVVFSRYDGRRYPHHPPSGAAIQRNFKLY